tara:strand:+ start:2000 stop:2260 length:261 start_codon:yes stop_codon:yes gene_type:complete
MWVLIWIVLLNEPKSADEVIIHSQLKIFDTVVQCHNELEKTHSTMEGASLKWDEEEGVFSRKYVINVDKSIMGKCMPTSKYYEQFD